MSADKEKQKLALQGGLKALSQIGGRGKPKIGTVIRDVTLFAVSKGPAEWPEIG